MARIGAPVGDKGILVAARVPATTAVQSFADADLRAAALADFDARMKDRKYTTLIPEGQPATKAIR